MVYRAGGSDAVEAALHAVGEYADDAEDFGSGFAQGLDHLDGAAAGGDEVFDDDDLGAGVHAALDAVRPSVRLCFTADITHRESEDGGRDGSMGDTCR